MQLIPLLREGGAHVRALVRNPAKAGALAPLGVELVEGDLDRPRTLGRGFDGVDTLMSIVPPGARAPQQTSSLLWAARQAGVRHVVRLSAVGAAHDAPTLNSRLHALSDAELERSGIAYTILKPHFFMQNLFMSRDSIAKEGAIYMALGDGKLGMIDVADIAAVAARVLLDPAAHAGKTYTPTGPKSIGLHEVAAAFSEALRKPVRYVPIPVEAAAQALAGFGLDELTIDMLTDYFRAYAAGWGDFVTDDVERITGRPARSIAELAQAVAPALSSTC
jgi:uncharacterized protein YbjT (DUF2867 family)